MSGRVGDFTPADREDELGIESEDGERHEDFGPEEDDDDLGICARCAFYGTAVKRERDAAEMSAQIDGLRRRIGDLKGEIKILKAKIAGQRAEIREKEAEIMRVSMRTPDTNFDRFAFMPEMEHGAQISTAFSFYLEEQYPPKLRGAVCMDRAYYDFLLWLFSAPGKKGATR